MPSKSHLLAGFALISGLALDPAQADDLRGALTQAYNTNPSLQAARDQQKAVDEGVPLASADGLPSASATASETEFVKKSPLNFTSPDRVVSLSATLNVPIYSGGAVRNAVHAADTRVAAGKDDLRGSESGLFSQVVAAYMDVIQNQAIVGLNRHNVEALTLNYEVTKDRFQIGDLTRTDVAQSESRLALARGNTQGSEANLIAARERYIQVVGVAPIDLAPPPPLPGLPNSPEAAVAVALDSNPDLLAARQRSKASGYDVRIAEAAHLPKLGVFVDSAYSNFLGTLVFAGAAAAPTVTADFGIRATIPLFQGGRPAAQVRQSQARQGQALENEIAAERSVISQTRAAFASLQAANAIIASNQVAVDAATLGLEGVRAENSVGNRTVLDILNAEQELLNAQVQLVAARRNAYVSGFTLLAAMGKAEARDLGLDGGALYDPDLHYQATRHALWDWGRDPEPKAQATRTVDTSAQDGSISAK